MISGDLLIGNDSRRGKNGELFGTEAATGRHIDPSFGGAELADLDLACQKADAAYDLYRETPLKDRAAFLDKIADNITTLGDTLVDRCVAETGLPRSRIEGERGRTVNQLGLFATVLRDGRFLDVRIDPALPGRKPQPRPDLRLRHIGIGPVGVFGASNFPLAFSVAGGDTASALAAGCPVIAKAHSAHPGTSALVGSAIQSAARDCGLPDGTFSLLFDSGRSISQALVADHRIKAIGFTGSRRAGTAFMQIAAERPEPIPVYAEMSSINPVIIFPHALASRGAMIGKQLVSALTLGAGQFCTNPGLILVIDGEGYEAFIEAARQDLEAVAAATMLTPGILHSYRTGAAKLASHPLVKTIAQGRVGEELQGQAVIFETTAESFLKDKSLHDEVFGASTLIVRVKALADLRRVLQALEGQLTIAMHIEVGDYPDARQIVPLLERKAGRLIVDGFGTGVEVGHAMVHGGPFPATSDVRTTSVGSLAINRFLRPLSYQSFPTELLSPFLRHKPIWEVAKLWDMPRSI